MEITDKKFRLFAGNTHPKLAQEIADILDTPLSAITLKKFSCGEIFVNLEETVRGRDVFIINTINRETVSEDFMETFIMCDAAKRSFAERVHVIIPHFGYARQDKIHDARESISAKLMAGLLTKSGADHVITLHLHADQIQAFFDVPVDNLSPKRMLVDKIKEQNLENPIIVSPDAGGAKYAKKIADMLGVELAILHKSRPAHNQAVLTHLIGNVEGKTAILVDDMVDTAGSVVGAKEALIKAGANKELCLVTTHPVFSGPAVDRLREAKFHKIIATNSMPLPKGSEDLNIEVVSVAPLIANVIQNVMEKRSVSKLFF
ncbi:MAG: ribose-phosphate diphosphokinase [Candidatus Gracilibacteria bacterium]|jgi:ribose-phosphate pyrophosphokinase|nr:ribose-phosphate diphosphokinase [Candidatus Gracilibacteria bacterium]